MEVAAPPISPIIAGILTMVHEARLRTAAAQKTINKVQGDPSFITFVIVGASNVMVL